MATTIITTTPQEDARIAPTFGRRLGLQSSPGVFRNATALEIKNAVIAYVTQVVLEEELAAGRRAVDAAVVPIAPT